MHTANRYGYIAPDEDTTPTLAAVRFRIETQYLALRQGLVALQVEVERAEKSAISYRQSGCLHGHTLDMCSCLGDCYVRIAHLKAEMDRLSRIQASMLPETHTSFLHQA